MSISTRIDGLVEQLGRDGIDIERERADAAALTATATDMLELARLLRDEEAQQERARRLQLEEQARCRTRANLGRAAVRAAGVEHHDDAETRAIDTLANVLHWLYGEQDPDDMVLDRLEAVMSTFETAGQHFRDELTAAGILNPDEAR